MEATNSRSLKTEVCILAAMAFDVANLLGEDLVVARSYAVWASGFLLCDDLFEIDLKASLRLVQAS